MQRLSALQSSHMCNLWSYIYRPRNADRYILTNDRLCHGQGSTFESNKHRPHDCLKSCSLSVRKLPYMMMCGCALYKLYSQSRISQRLRNILSYMLREALLIFPNNTHHQSFHIGVSVKRRQTEILSRFFSPMLHKIIFKI